MSTGKVNSEHPEYKDFKPLWDKCILVQEGEEAVKEAGTMFLPRLKKQDDEDYQAYKARALFFNAVDRTLGGLVGAVFSRLPIMHIDGKEDKEFFDSLSIDKKPFVDFAKKVFMEVLNPSRVGLLGDVSSDGGEPYIVMYNAEAIINWKEETINGVKQLTLVTLREEILGDDPKDEFGHVTKTQWRVLDLDSENRYRQRLFIQSEEDKDVFIQVGSDIYPTKQGIPLNFIPFVIINPSHLGTKVVKPIALDMVNVNLSHFRSSADLEHGRHFTGLPTAWVAGFSPKTTNLVIGSQMAWVSSNPQANAGFLEFTGQGLGALENALKEKEKLLSVLGARLLEPQTLTVESAQTHMIKKFGENSILSNIADTVSAGITWMCQVIADWRNLNRKIRVELNKEYTQVTADPQLLSALLALLQQGAISFDTLFYNLKRLQLVPVERTKEDEEALIDLWSGLPDMAKMVTAIPEPDNTEGEE